jgi:thiol-disulfide isomerase/thioredoxin
MIKKIAYSIAFILLLLHTQAKAQTQDSTTVPIVGFDYVQQLMQQKNDTTYVINFWATWCAPCVKELPYFETLTTKYSDKKIKVILVSLDFKKNYHSALLPFLKKRGIKSPVVLLYEPDANAWIEKVNKDWSGAIPATLVFNKNKSAFHEDDFTEAELHTFIDNFFKP